MLFEPFPKGSGWFTYILIITLHPITLVSIYDTTFLSDEIFIFWCHQEVFDGFASFEENLNAIFLASIFDTFPQAFDVWHSYVCSSFGMVVISHQSLVFVSGLFVWHGLLLCPVQGPPWVLACCEGTFNGTAIMPYLQSTVSSVLCFTGQKKYVHPINTWWKSKTTSSKPSQHASTQGGPWTGHRRRPCHTNSPETKTRDWWEITTIPKEEHT